MGKSSQQGDSENPRKKARRKLTVRPTPDELVLLRRRARGFGYKSLSRYLIERGLRDGVMIQSTDREKLERLLFEVRKIGNNLNRIAVALSKGKGTYSQAIFDRVLEQVERVLGEVTGEVKR